MNWGLYVLSKGEVFTGSQVVLHEEEEEEEEEGGEKGNNEKAVS
jgi:hypothetical protein|tara:strand:+ start:258 stop:389 length:132 start_codon:yes stop_codon:yes gene_type:complete